MGEPITKPLKEKREAAPQEDAEILAAIRSGQVEALIVGDANAEKLFALKSFAALASRTMRASTWPLRIAARISASSCAAASLFSFDRLVIRSPIRRPPVALTCEA